MDLGLRPPIRDLRQGKLLTSSRLTFQISQMSKAAAHLSSNPPQLPAVSRVF